MLINNKQCMKKWKKSKSGGKVKSGIPMSEIVKALVKAGRLVGTATFRKKFGKTCGGVKTFDLPITCPKCQHVL